MWRIRYIICSFLSGYGLPVMITNPITAVCIVIEGFLKFFFTFAGFFRSIPAAWRPDFAAESKEAESKMVSLKNWLQFSEVKITKK